MSPAEKKKKLNGIMLKNFIIQQYFVSVLYSTHK